MKRYFRKLNTYVMQRLLQYLPERKQITKIEQDLLNNQVAQKLILLHYQHLRNSEKPLPKIAESGFRTFSQTDEDGILLYIFSLIGFTNKICVDIAAGTPYGANTTNLICNWGWTGLLVEANEELFKETKQFYESHPDTWIYPPKIINTWITAENINTVIEENRIIGEIDLFSLDVDGIDYWLWKSLDVIKPRVVLVEYQDVWGPDKSVTVPYHPEFTRPDSSYNYCGASLSAFVKLGKEKGYRLVASNRYGFNAFFVREDLAGDMIPEISAHQCFHHPLSQEGQRVRLPQALAYEWEEV